MCVCVRVGERERVSDRESKSEGKREKWKERGRAYDP